jgi:hypothetical protein
VCYLVNSANRLSSFVSGLVKPIVDILVDARLLDDVADLPLAVTQGLDDAASGRVRQTPDLGLLRPLRG